MQHFRRRRNAKFYSYASVNLCRASKLQQVPIQHFKTQYFSFFPFCGSFLPPWICISINRPYHIQIQSGTGSETLSDFHWIPIYDQSTQVWRFKKRFPNVKFCMIKNRATDYKRNCLDGMKIWNNEMERNYQTNSEVQYLFPKKIPLFLTVQWTHRERGEGRTLMGKKRQ